MQAELLGLQGEINASRRRKLDGRLLSGQPASLAFSVSFLQRSSLETACHHGAVASRALLEDTAFLHEALYLSFFRDPLNFAALR